MKQYFYQVSAPAPRAPTHTRKDFGCHGGSHLALRQRPLCWLQIPNLTTDTILPSCGHHRNDRLHKYFRKEHDVHLKPLVLLGSYHNILCSKVIYHLTVFFGTVELQVSEWCRKNIHILNRH